MSKNLKEKGSPTTRESESSRSRVQSINGQSTQFIDHLNHLHRLDDKFCKAMVNNAQLDNEKQALTYQIELYKDDIEELEENLIRLQKDYKDKCRNFDQLNRDLKKLQKDSDYYRECLKRRDYLIEEAGLVLIDSEEFNLNSHSECNHMNGINGVISDKRSESFGDESGSESSISVSATAIAKAATNASLISQEASQLLAGVEGLTLEAKIKTLLNERKLFMNDINQMKTELEEERQRSTKLEELTLMEGSNSSLNSDTKLDVQREANRLVSDYKFKLKKCEQEITVLNGNVARLETQLSRYRSAADESERLEDELKTDKRKLQRELREAVAKVEELETSNAHLQKRIDKLKSNRNIIIPNK